MNSPEKIASEPDRDFLQKGLHSYKAVVVAVSEFRRQVSAKIMGVLDEFATRLSDVGLPIAGLKLVMRPGLDDIKLSEDCASIKLESNLNGITVNYHILWEADPSGACDVKLGVFIWADLQEKRRSLFAALQKEQAVLKKSSLSQDKNGLSRLTLDCDPDLFYKVEEPFRVLITEWIDLLAASGGTSGILLTSQGSIA